MMKRESLTDYLARGGRVTLCPPTRRQAPSLRRMRRAAESAARQLLAAEILVTARPAGGEVE
jgi:hypothetical protein